MPKVEVTDGTPGDDVINGGNAQDWINGLGGDDEISGGNQHDVLSGDGDGSNDDLSGNNGKDKVNGGSGSDNVSGGNGKDHLTAGPTDNDDSDDVLGPNYLTGGNGKDVIVSSFAFCFEEEEESDSDDGSDADVTVLVCPISDIMTGGRAPDTFVFFGSHGADTITDFWKDTIDLTGLQLANGFDDLSYANNADGNVVIDTTEGTITLEGVDASEVEADMFLF